MIKTDNRKKGKNKYAAPVGGIFILLALVGLITVVVQSIKITGNLLDNSDRIKSFERFLAPVVMFDPVPFENAENADPVFLLQASLWQTAFGEKRDTYAYDDNGLMIIPASDVDMAAKTLFGADAKLAHRSFGDFENTYNYDATAKVYRVPLLVSSGYYSPMVEKITRSGNKLILRVGYLPSGGDWLSDSSGSRYTPKPDKYMNYTMQKEGKEYVLVSVTDTDDIFGSHGGLK